MKKPKAVSFVFRFCFGIVAVLFFQFLSPSTETTWLDFSGEIAFASPSFSKPAEIVRTVKSTSSGSEIDPGLNGYVNSQIFQGFTERISSLLKPEVKSFRIVSIESAPSHSKFRWPVFGSISSGYGLRRHPVTRRRSFHAGIDIRSKYGTPIVTPCEGVVVNSSRVGANGRMVRILTPGGLTLSFAHLSGYKCSRGQKVRQGQVVGLVGSSGRATGPHLHFTVQKNGRYINPMIYLGTK